MSGASPSSEAFSAAAAALFAAAGDAMGRTLEVNWDALRRLLDGLLERAVVWGDLVAKPTVKACPAPGDFEGDALLFLQTALLGEGFRASFGGEWERDDLEGGWAIVAPEGGWCVRFPAQECAARHPLPQSAEALATQAGRVAERLKSARRVVAEIDTTEASAELEVHLVHLADLEPAELARWIERQSERFAEAAGIFLGRTIAADGSGGIAALDEWLAGEAHLRTASSAHLRRLSFFYGECARAVWTAEHRIGSAWTWMEAYEEVGIALSKGGAPTRNAGGLVFFPHDEILAHLEGLRKSASSLADPVKRFVDRVLDGGGSSAGEERGADWSGMGHEITDTAEMSVAELEETAKSTVRHDEPGRDTSLDPIRLTADLSLSPAVFAVRRQSIEMNAGQAADLVLPCRYDLRHGAMPLALIPIDQRPLDTRQEIEREFAHVFAEIERELAPRKLVPDVHVGFLRGGGAKGDLLLVARPPLLVGGSRRFDFFFIADGKSTPEGPLDEEAWLRIDFFNETALNVRKAKYHLQHTGNATEARRLLELAIADSPDDAQVLMGMCMLELAIGNQIRARGFVQRLLEVDPKHPDARLLDARFLVDEERFDDAAAQVESLLRDVPDNPEALLVRVRIRLMNGDEAGARSDLALVLELDPENREALMLERALQHSMLR